MSFLLCTLFFSFVDVRLEFIDCVQESFLFLLHNMLALRKHRKKPEPMGRNLSKLLCTFSRTKLEVRLGLQWVSLQGFGTRILTKSREKIKIMPPTNQITNVGIQSPQFWDRGSFSLIKFLETKCKKRFAMFTKLKDKNVTYLLKICSG